MHTDGKLRQELLGIDTLGSNRFLEMGRRLRLFYENLPDGQHKKKAIHDLLRGTKVGFRSAMYWIDIDRIYSCFDIPDERLVRIGWSKLSIIAPHLSHETVEEWLSFAERNTSNAVRARILSLEPAKHYVVFRLSAEQHGILTAALIANGAKPLTSRALADKEDALITLCRNHRKQPAGKAR